MAAKKGVAVKAKSQTIITNEEVRHIAKLANLPLAPGEESKFARQFADTLKTINIINELDTSGVEPTSQVTGLTNVTREDVIDKSRILPLEEVLKRAPKSHNGYIVVPAIFDQ
jgi:aspartyl-tRNA(Asn)/glutamyl-tRNA(Gln) amidotransferase subunit C